MNEECGMPEDPTGQNEPPDRDRRSAPGPICAGLGASHQTGWTGIIALTMHLFATTTSEQILELGKRAAVTEVERPRSGRTKRAARRRVSESQSER